jgi:hypothetical protein
MADTDAASVTFARQANSAKAAVHRDVSALRPLLAGLGYADETRLLGQFDAHLRAYEALDRQILDLAVENTNLKAQQLSFGAAQAAADDFTRSLEGLAPAHAADLWRVRATAANAVSAVREIQVLQAQHIPSPEDAAMTSIEARMTAQETTTREALTKLAPLVEPPSRQHLADAGDALRRFLDANSQIVSLSRRNTNVRSLVLSLNQKPALVTPCSDSLRALGDALAHRGYPKGRWD